MTQLDRKAFLRTAGLTTLAAAGGTALTVAMADSATAGEPVCTTTSTGPIHDQGGQLFNVTNSTYGAKANTIRSSRGGSISSGSTTFSETALAADTSTGTAITFTSADIGKVITIQGAGASGGVLSTTIAAVISGDSVTVANAASTTVTDAAFAFGTDDTAAIVAAITAAGTTGTLFLPAGIYTIRGASNGGNRITHASRGGMRGQGGKSFAADDPRRGPNTVLLCSDASAGLIANGCARYDSFMCDGNNIATQPLQNGVVVSNAVTSAGSQATFLDVWAAGSAGTGWSIFGAKNNGYYDCGTVNNKLDGLYIDGGATGLLFVAFRQHGDLRYGIHGDSLVTAIGGSTQPVSAVRFFSGLLGDGAGRPAGISTLYLRNAVDWRFPHTRIVGTNLTGPTIDLDQSNSHSLDLSHCSISASHDASNTLACIKISGTPGGSNNRIFLTVDGCSFLAGDRSIWVTASPGLYRYSAQDGWRDATTFGAAVAAGLPAFDTLFDGRTGPWQTATAVAPWTGTVSYRVMAERWVELKGSVVYSGAGSGPVFNLPLGYRPPGTRRVPASASSGLAAASVSTTGDVSLAPVGAAFPANATVYLDGVSFTIGGA